MSDPDDQDTIPPPLRATALGRQTIVSSLPSASVKVDSFGMSDRGRVRVDNQDHFYLGKLGRFSQTIATSLPVGELPDRLEEAGHVAVVADGMGGHAGGEVASRTAIIVFFHLLFDTPDWVMRVDDDESAAKILDRVSDRYRSLDSLLDERARIDPNLQGMGTTMTLMYSLGFDLFLAHAGDSRAYLCRDGVLKQLTRDHTRVQELVDAGMMTREEAADGRRRPSREAFPQGHRAVVFGRAVRRGQGRRDRLDPRRGALRRGRVPLPDRLRHRARRPRQRDRGRLPLRIRLKLGRVRARGEEQRQRPELQQMVERVGAQ
jgi:serine/threonine protein phosphatase PrpC